jgi:hypothetical protein
MDAEMLTNTITQFVIGLIPALFIVFLLWDMFLRDFIKDIIDIFNNKK